MKKIPMLERFAAQSLVEYDGELIFSKEKFAQLIVLECINGIANDTANYEGVGMMSYYQGVQDAVKSIRKHFGVEE
jgi:hypothetical protein